MEQRLLAGTPENLGGAAPPSPPSRYFGYGGRDPGGGTLGNILGGYVPPGTPNWHPVLKKISPKIDTPF